MEFYKYHGTGNDFIVLENMRGDGSKLAQKICHRHYGIGADGLMAYEPSTQADVKMLYFNQDGSRAAMCGNGLRCFARFVFETQKVKKDVFDVETDAGIYQVDLTQGFDRIGFEHQSDIQVHLHQLVIANQMVTAYETNMGADHAIIFYDEEEKNALVNKSVAECIRDFQGFERSVNVNFVKVNNFDEMDVTTFERGVGWTLSCGTGVLASQAVAHRLKKTHSDVNVRVPGGNLFVRVEPRLLLEGPAVLIAKGQWIEGGKENV